MNKKVIIIGAGGHAKSIADIVIKSNDSVLGFLDDNILLDTEIIHNPKINVIGKVDDCFKFEDAEFIIAIGSNNVRQDIANKYKLKYYTAIHPSANIALDVSIGEGTTIMANACINTSARVGSHCIINTGAIIEHDNIIEDFVHVSPNAALAGSVLVGTRSHIGVGATIKNNIKITNDTIIGAGAVVVKNIEEEGTYIGIPAKRKEKGVNSL